MADANDERPRSLRVDGVSDKRIQHACIAVLAYAGLRALSAIVGALQQPDIAVWFLIDFVVVAIVLGALAFAIFKRSRIAVVLAIVYIVATQLYVWFGLGSATGTIVSVIVTGFLLRGGRRVFETHRERGDSVAAAEPEAP
ncbi:MAG TPA: hypothetical protein VK993_08130 [Chthoniobacterales bacterium]|nr:hypothetical protein [Chthoniobacterales bacterium]